MLVVFTKSYIIFLLYRRISEVKSVGFDLSLSPFKALRAEGQATKNLLTLVELLHIRRRYHGDAVAVRDTVVLHSQAITRYDANQKERRN